uniref:Rieske domain-containing protein n=1 Tax=Peronospora matthiolae TaxID=2874970 RepID=A0AAV1UME3_9STRA
MKRMFSLQRRFSTGRRVLCSVQELKDLKGQGLKFPVHVPEPKLSSTPQRIDAKSTLTKSPRRRDALITGFVFWNEKTQQPRSFLNRCPHALLELDFDDSDFFCEGFIFCKAHAAFFDPETGVCLRGPTSSRKPLSNLDALRVGIDGDDVVLLTTNDGEVSKDVVALAALNDHDLAAYKRAKQQELSDALFKRSEASSEVEKIQQQVHQKTMARLKQYELLDERARTQRE